ncbi:MAG: SusD/RagB family nutrient-binding outer membrane lipoprotein [Bacteroidales bacterium]|nr:SusD/RagB family nutrient-binding outer membrane lipoprotein [Bacteroidales bacterium]
MKTRYIIASIFMLSVCITSCDKDFEEINKNPLLPTSLDPMFMLAKAQQMGTTMHHYEGSIIQQLNLVIGGNEEGGNRNTVVESNMSSRFNFYYGNVKTLVDIINTLKDNPDRTNLFNMARIMKAYAFQILVDLYGDIPYNEAGLVYISGIDMPKYDNQEVIYADLEKELTEAVNELDPTKDKISGEIFFAGDISKWKKFGNSLLLRLGMRYTKIDETKAKSIVLTATEPQRGGVMTSNDDNVIIKWNSIQNNPITVFCNTGTRQNWHVGRPFTDFLYNNNDPRMPYSVCLYPVPASASDPGTPNTNPADQIGCPYGYDEVTIVNDPYYPGTISAGVWKYSQFNRKTLGRVDSWQYLVTYAQTQLLLAEARYRDYISTGTAEEFYEAGIRAHMTQKDIWGTSGSASPITEAEITNYLAQPAISFDPDNGLKQINEQYWVACLMIWHEGWANFRRSGYPQLNPINFPGEDYYADADGGGDGFIHRLIYPFREYSSNQKNVQAAADRMSGDNVGIHLFWDK